MAENFGARNWLISSLNFGGKMASAETGSGRKPVGNRGL